jgi:hypothetical protein
LCRGLMRKSITHADRILRQQKPVTHERQLPN